MALSTHSRFEFSGEFAGFIRNVEGKRRLMLRFQDGTAVEIKVLKEIRKKWMDRLHPGDRLAVAGLSETRLSGECRRVAYKIELLGTAHREAEHDGPCGRCPLWVCAKKNCWNSGGRELYERLNREVAERGLHHVVEIKTTGCMGNCKKRPAVAIRKKLLDRCDKGSAQVILETLRSRA